MDSDDTAVLDWIDSLTEDDIADILGDEDESGLGEVLSLAMAGVSAVAGFEPFLLKYLPTSGSFMAPLFNVSAAVH